MKEPKTPFTKPIYLLISLLIGAVLGIFYALPKLNTWLNLTTKAFLPTLIIIGLLVFSLKDPKNHSHKFVFFIFITDFLGFFIANYLVNLFLNQSNAEIIIFSFLLILLYLAHLYALNPKNEYVNNLLFLVIFLIITWVAILVPIFLPFLYLCLFFMTCVWLIQWFSRPIDNVDKKNLVLRLLTAFIMVVVSQLLFTLEQNKIKQNAYQLSAKIIAYQAKNGHFPSNETVEPLKTGYINYYYRQDMVKPSLSYGDITDPYCRFNFDFDTHKWADKCKRS